MYLFLLFSFFSISDLSARDFLIGWYNNENILEMPLSTGHGENAILVERTWKDDSSTQATWDYNYINEWAFLNEAGNQNVKVMLELNRDDLLNNTSLLYDHVTGVVNYAKNSTNLLAWHLFDEPEFEQALMPISRLESVYSHIKTLDPAHPVFMSFGVESGTSVEHVRDYKNAMDGFAFDRYPVGVGFPENYGAMWEVTLTAIHAGNLAAQEGLDFYYVCIQAHQGENLRLPTYNETRYLVYASVVHGADGALFWTPGEIDERYSTPQSHRDNVVNPIVAEVDSLKEAIDNESTVSVTSNHDSDTTGHGINNVTYYLGETDDAYYLFVLCNTGPQYDVRFWVSGLSNVNSTVEVVNENRTVSIHNFLGIKWIDDDLGTYDVNIYKFTKN